MAAHIVTGLQQVIVYIDQVNAGHLDVEWLKMTLDGATRLWCWTDDDTNTWNHLYEFVKNERSMWNLKSILQDDLARMEIEKMLLSRSLGREIRTREDWLEAKFGK